MESATSPRLSLRVALAAMLASGALLYFATGLQPVAWLAWIAPWPVLVAAHRSNALRGAALCIGAWLIGGSNLVPYLHEVLSIPAPIVVLAIALPGLQFALVALLSRKLAERGRHVAAVLALPAAWVAIDYLQSLGSPHGTFGNLAYTQLDLLPVVQLASLTGVWGVDFLLMLVPSALAVLFVYPVPRPARLGIVIATAAACVSMLAFGAWRLATPDGKAVRVALIASDEPKFATPVASEGAQRMLAGVEEEIAHVAGQHPRFIVLPETIVELDAATIPAFASRFQRLAQASGAAIIVGVDLKDRDSERNTALVFDPAGAPVARYAKQHLLPPFEARYQPGHSLFTGNAAGTAWGVAICKDMDFPALSRQYAQAGTGLMVVPAWDFVRDGRLHARMAVMRGIESGFAVVRSARTGRMTVSDAYGRVIAERTSAAPVTSIVEDVATGSGNTYYAHFGDGFAWLSLALAGGCILLLLAPAKRSGP